MRNLKRCFSFLVCSCPMIFQSSAAKFGQIRKTGSQNWPQWLEQDFWSWFGWSHDLSICACPNFHEFADFKVRRTRPVSRAGEMPRLAILTVWISRCRFMTRCISKLCGKDFRLSLRFMCGSMCHDSCHAFSFACARFSCMFLDRLSMPTSDHDPSPGTKRKFCGASNFGGRRSRD